jgi:hypothetical protein
VVLIRLTPGRSLRWSPPWPCSDAAVLFDASSGDYWVLSAQARVAVGALEHDGPLGQDELAARLACTRDEASALLDELARSGIITALASEAPVSPEPAVDELD